MKYYAVLDKELQNIVYGIGNTPDEALNDVYYHNPESSLTADDVVECSKQVYDAVIEHGGNLNFHGMMSVIVMRNGVAVFDDEQ